MAIKIGFGGLMIAAIIFGVLYFNSRKKRKVVEEKLAEYQSAE